MKEIKNITMNVLQMLKITFEVILVIGFIFFEELIWKKLALPIKNYLATLDIFGKLQVKIESQNVYTILGLFVSLFVIVELMGLWATGLFLTGSVIAGVVVYGLKVPLAGFVFWMFSFTKDKLLTIEWFATVYGLIVQLFDWVKATRIYRRVKVQIYMTKKYFKNATAGSFKDDIKNTYRKMKEVFKKDQVETQK